MHPVEVYQVHSVRTLSPLVHYVYFSVVEFVLSVVSCVLTPHQPNHKPQGFYGKCNGTRMAAISPLHVYNVLCPACSGDEAYDDSRFLLCYMGSNLLKNADAIITV